MLALRAVIFRDHRQALAALPGGHDDPGANGNSRDLVTIAKLAHAAGLDSIQYTHRDENGPTGNGHSTNVHSLYEVQDVRDVSTVMGVCPNAVVLGHMRGGWNASLACDCKSANSLLNCGMALPRMKSESACITAEETLCGHADTSMACFECIGAHQTALLTMGCSHTSFSSFCNNRTR
jgi:hypothetical protein